MLNRNDGATTFFVVEKPEETNFDFSQNALNITDGKSENCKCNERSKQWII